MVHSLISKLGLLSQTLSQRRRISVVEPRRATKDELCIYHDEDYVDYVLGSGQNETEDSAAEFGIEDVRFTKWFRPLVACSPLK